MFRHVSECFRNTFPKHYLTFPHDSAHTCHHPKLDGQDLIVQHNEVGHRLACLLAPGPANAQVIWRGDDLHWRIPHTARVDRLLTELAGLFISIRYAHPTLVQLELQLYEAAP
jgi:hypothetical protein